MIIIISVFINHQDIIIIDPSTSELRHNYYRKYPQILCIKVSDKISHPNSADPD